MPKLDETQIAERLAKRLEELKLGEKVAIRGLRSLLTESQAAEIDIEWEKQKLFRKGALHAEDRSGHFVKKSKRDVQIEVVEKALRDALNGEVAAWEKRIQNSEVRQAKIFLKSISKEVGDGKTLVQAKVKANNSLTQAGLRRLDSYGVRNRSQRDKEVLEMEQRILGRTRSEMTPEELEQLELIEEHEKARRERGKKLGK